MENGYDDVWAIIPARGGSKGIRDKNLQTIGGMALISRTIRAAKNSNRIQRIFVSTDSADIASTAQNCGAEVVVRPEQLALDTSSTESAILHCLEELGREASLPGITVLLQCTSPFTTGEQIDMVIDSLAPPSINSSFSARRWHGFLWNDEGEGLNHNELVQRSRRQDLNCTLLETGAIYAVDTASFLEAKNRFVVPVKPVVIDGICFEIDSVFDLELCRAIEASGMF